ncbi:MAG TPA: small ribosomal subunit Rsm22 family protein [Candidatus Angelobacter sp.]|nr:small ribosomal subunit Rsm22 family protein [Candidatus Angelobacter sp.]
MRLARELETAVNQETQHLDGRLLAQAATQLSHQYRDGDFSTRVISSAAHRAAYLTVRLPATLAAIWRVLSEVHSRADEVAVHDLLDLGSGPGAALFAASEVFPSLAGATLLESDAALLETGKRLAAHSSLPAVRNALWRLHDLRSGLKNHSADLVTASYVLGELPSGAAETLVRQAWTSTREFLVLVEPGTPRGFGVINKARSLLIASGAHILAPCPHAGPCPLAASGDWCHFAQRIERTAQHRRLKGGALGHEDEKLSYVVASRRDLRPASARIVRHPQKYSGYVKLTLCTTQGIESRTVSRSQKENYKPARKAEWGDAWEPA